MFGLQCERKLKVLMRSVEGMKGHLDDSHKEHGRVKTEEQV